MNFSEQPIGIFDSGVGGLTVAKSIKELLPNEQIIYFGDTLHLPYGEKSSRSIIRYSKQITQFLLEQNCKAVVIACNSASAYAYEATKECVPKEFPVINVIDPVVKKVRDLPSSNKVGVIGTKATIRSMVYQDRISPKEIAYLETPLLASMIEEGFVNDRVSQSVISAYLGKPELLHIDTLILGCTHYPLLEKEIRAFYKDNINIVNSGRIVAHALQEKLIQLGLLNSSKIDRNDEFYVSDYTSSFEQITESFFGSGICLKELKIT